MRVRARAAAARHAGRDRRAARAIERRPTAAIAAAFAAHRRRAAAACRASSRRSDIARFNACARRALRSTCGVDTRTVLALAARPARRRERRRRSTSRSAAAADGWRCDGGGLHKLSATRAHRPRRHRQGPRGRSRGRRAASTPASAPAGSTPAATCARSAPSACRSTCATKNGGGVRRFARLPTARSRPAASRAGSAARTARRRGRSARRTSASPRRVPVGRCADQDRRRQRRRAHPLLARSGARAWLH